ncbi:hypothetical protein GCM10027162_06690 [Streptomyces incanus]
MPKTEQPVAIRTTAAARAARRTGRLGKPWAGGRVFMRERTSLYAELEERGGDENRGREQGRSRGVYADWMTPAGTGANRVLLLVVK